VVVELDASGPAQYLVMPPQFGVVAAWQGSCPMTIRGKGEYSLPSTFNI
jgi:hypothetical protein